MATATSILKRELPNDSKGMETMTTQSPPKRLQVHKQEACASSGPAFVVDKKEESFDSLLGRFASLNVGKDSTEEKCFICGKTVLLKKFPEHIHECVEALRKNDEETHLAQMAAAGVPVCNSYCQKTDYSHFMSHYHPPAHCPVCNEEMPLYEMEAHLALCMASTAPEDTEMDPAEERRGIVHVTVNGNNYLVDLNELVQTNMKTGKQRSIMRSQTGWKWKSDDGLFIPFDPRNNSMIEDCMERLLGEKSETGMDDGSSEEKKKSTKVAKRAPSLVDLLDQKFKVSSGSDGNKDSKLTKTQMAACAALIVKEKNKPEIEKSVPLSRLMQSFASLGITKENLKKEL